MRVQQNTRIQSGKRAHTCLIWHMCSRAQKRTRMFARAKTNTRATCPHMSKIRHMFTPVAIGHTCFTRVHTCQNQTHVFTHAETGHVCSCVSKLDMCVHACSRVLKLDTCFTHVERHVCDFWHAVKLSAWTCTWIRHACQKFCMHFRNYTHAQFDTDVWFYTHAQFDTRAGIYTWATFLISALTSLHF